MTPVLNRSTIFNRSVSAAALIIAMTAIPAQAQQIINNGDNITVTSGADGETITAGIGVISAVDAAPVVVVNNNDVTVNNDGTLRTTGVTQTIQVNQGTTGATINNGVSGVLEADSRVVNFDGTDATLNNDGIIRGTGSQRNGAVYGNRTSNNININNSATGLIDAGIEGAGIAIEVGGGGAPRGGTIVNNGTVQGRGQAAPTGGTAGDGLRFFGPGLAPEYVYNGDITNGGTINSESLQGPTAGVRFANRIGFQGTLDNSGTISGANNGLYFGNDADHTGGIVNNSGTISSDSRALNIDGAGLVVNNIAGAQIIGTSNQRNGTVYADSTAQDFTLNNDGIIDAGAGNEGAGFSVELAAEGNAFDINNTGTIQGRGTAGAGLTTAGDGVRFERERVAGALDGATTGLFTGNITNSGTIDSEGDSGTTAGIRFVNGVSFNGTITNEAGGTISGVQNGLYFGNATPAGGGDFTGAVVNNAGTISSGSRALNIDGTGLVVNNTGSIIGTANQRNGTVYADSTAQDFVLNNDGIIDAGAGLEGAGFSTELSAAGNAFDINNSGTIQGRGTAGAGLTTAGDGVRFERARNAGVLDGSSVGLFTGNITNSGTINSEGDSGTTAGIRFVNGVSFNGTIENQAGGTIFGVQNGLYFGNATPAGGGDFTGAVVNNAGTISSSSRALNIDGTGLVVNNTGSILGTGNQRNGTVYADSTAQDFTLNNDGTIDAGAGNQGAGFSVELSATGNAFDINNTGTIQGRGTAGAGLTAAGDGVRFERARNAGVLDGSSVGLFTGNITNSGTIDSEGDSGTTAGVRFVNGVSFSGTIDNQVGGTISGIQNGLYFGNATPAGGGDFTGAVVNNAGTISSSSRALNIDGTGLVVNNTGSILGTGNQRNGTVYADGTANNFTLNNLASGIIDAGAGNQGSGVSLQLGNADGDVRNISLTNAGTINGRGDALASGATAGLRLFNGAGAGTSVTVNGDIDNSGTITSETAAALLIENVNFTGTFTNNGTLTGTSAVDASTALGGLTFVQNGGALNGNFVGSAFADGLAFTSGSSTLAGDVQGGVDVTVDSGAELAISGIRAVDGDFTSNGTLAFELGNDSLAIAGNSSFGADSVINIETPTDVANLTIGAPINVVTETGTFTDNGLTVNVADDDFLLDYTVQLGSVTVTPTAVDLSAVSADANISSFGGALTSALSNNRLAGDVANSLNSSADLAAFEASALGLLPAINDGVAREIFETQRFSSSLLSRRLDGDATGIWGQAFYRTSDRDAQSQSAVGYDGDALGFTLGLDTKLNEKLTVGLLLNYSDIDVDSDGVVGAESDINSYQISGYAGLDLGAAFVNAELGYSFSDVDSRRNGITGLISSESDVDGVIAAVNGGYTLETGSFSITPHAGLRYASLSQDALTETGGLGLTLDTDRTDFLEGTLGLRLAGKVDDSKDLSIVPYANVAYVYDFIGDGLSVNGSFNAGLDTFRLTSAEPSESRFDLGAGLNLVNKGGFSIGAEYQGRFASDYQSHSGNIRVRFEF
ncbi:MAG: autotransporter domain-containing protein [Parasphingorhabdus sp.]|uniref:autotransporter domain-containing protein n=1 Tax=Alphaproteobacteria TaxID=28211 RepID=UPI00329681BA